MDPGTAALALSAVSAGISTVGSVKQGEAEAKALAAQAREKGFEARQADLQSRQIGAMRAKEEKSALAGIMAARAAKNLSGESPTEFALLKSLERESDNAKQNELLQANLQKLSALNAQSSLNQTARARVKTAWIGAAGDLVGAAAGGLSRFSKPAASENIGAKPLKYLKFSGGKE